jgi:hypothetical protein
MIDFGGEIWQRMIGTAATILSLLFPFSLLVLSPIPLYVRGRDQTDVLESTPIAFEVYACITCLYSQAALDEADFGETTSGNSS